MTGISSAELKRQIIQSAPKSMIKKEMEKSLPGIPEGEQIGWGNDLEATTKTKGFALMESYMFRKMNLVGLALDDNNDSKVMKGVARAYIELMQWIQLIIQTKDDILAKEKTKHASKTIPSEEET